MSDSRRRQEEIQRDEQWLARVCERSEEIDTTPLKRTVRIAVEERWLTDNLTTDAPVGLSRRVRRVVHQALAARWGAGMGGRSRLFRTSAWIGGGLAAAAAIALALIGPWTTADTSGGDDATTGLVAAFEELKDDDAELDQELSRLREALHEFDQTVANGWGEDSWEGPADDTSDPAAGGV